MKTNVLNVTPEFYSKLNAPSDFHHINKTYCRKINLGEWQNTPIQDQIDQIAGWWPRAPDRKEKPKRPRVGCRRNALMVIGEITGDPWRGFFYESTGRLDPRIEWVYETLLIQSMRAKSTKFLRIVAKDAGVWPPPKWWLVTRKMKKLQGRSTRRSF